jgi:hypothetical protein
MAKWRCLHETISLSRRLGRCSLLAALLYTWGIARADAHGMIRRDDCRLVILGRRQVSERQVQKAIDELIACGLLCQQTHNGDQWLHWCCWDYYQQESVRRRTTPPRFSFTCPNETGEDFRGAAEISAERRQTKTKTKIMWDDGGDFRRDTRQAASRLMAAVVAIWPGAGATYYQGYADLIEEYGEDFMWECWQAALRAGKTRPSANYLEAIARRCLAEGRRPTERQELRDDEGEAGARLPDEIDGRKVVAWVVGNPVFESPAAEPV